MKNNFTIVDDQGQEHTYDILFTFESEENGKCYVVYTDETLDENGQIVVYASTYDPDNLLNGRIEAIQTEQEWKVIETILETLQTEISSKYNELKTREFNRIYGENNNNEQNNEQ